MRKVIWVLMTCMMTLSLQAAQTMDCSGMSADVQQFALQLTPENQMMFCGQFTDGQRASAMQMISTPDATGAMMTPDAAVQKVAGANGATPKDKVPTGCPVK